MTEVGFPADPGNGRSGLLAGVPAGGVAVAGVGRLRPGEARYDLTTAGGARLQGTLVADINGHYGYVSNRRESFDTRSESSCDGDKCTYAFQLGDTRTSAVFYPTMNTILAAVYDERTLARRAWLLFRPR